MRRDGFGHLKVSLETVDAPPNNSLKLTRRAGPSLALAWPAGVA